MVFDKPEERIKLLFEKRKLIPEAEGRAKIDAFMT
jgi:hypothetical protein